MSVNAVSASASRRCKSPTSGKPLAPAGPRAAQHQNVPAGMPQIKHFVRQRLHQKQSASAFRVRRGQFDFRRPVETGGVIGDARLDFAFAGGNFKNDGPLARRGRRTYFTALFPASMSDSSHAPRSASARPSSPSQAQICATPARTAENSQAVSTRRQVRVSARGIWTAVFKTGSGQFTPLPGVCPQKRTRFAGIF